MRIAFFALAFLGLSLAVFAEDDKDSVHDVSDKSVRERIFFGGFVGAQFGTFTAVNVNAQVGYRVTSRISAGIGGTYQYENDRWLGQSISSHVYGGSLFGRFRVISHAFLHAEYEWLRFQSRVAGIDPGDRPRISEQNMLLGAGYGLPLSNRVRLNILLLYNLNENSQVYYDNPFFRVGVDIGL